MLRSLFVVLPMLLATPALAQEDVPELPTPAAEEVAPTDEAAAGDEVVNDEVAEVPTLDLTEAEAPTVDPTEAEETEPTAFEKWDAFFGR